jgi:HK97 gp10 family phage protein
LGVRIKYNHLPIIIDRLPKAIDDEVGEAAEDIAAVLKVTLWIDTGMVRRVTTDRAYGGMHAEVWIGYNRGHGFYSRFNEWGTVKMKARPIVGPTAHAYEPVYANQMSRAVRKACQV